MLARTLLATALLAAASGLAAAQAGRWACDVQLPPDGSCMAEVIAWSNDALSLELATGARVGGDPDPGVPFRVDPYAAIAHYNDNGFWFAVEARYPLDFLPDGVHTGGPVLRASFGSQFNLGLLGEEP